MLRQSRRKLSMLGLARIFLRVRPSCGVSIVALTGYTEGPMIHTKSPRTTQSPAARSWLLRSLLVHGVLLNSQCGAPEPPACAEGACVSQRLSALDSPAQPGPRRVARFDLTVPLAGGGSL